MQIKDGVRIYGIQPELVVGLLVVGEIYRRYDQSHRFVVTSVADGRHSRNSLHYVGHAVDLRLPLEYADEMIELIRGGLGADFDVVLESDHIHIEFQPKEAY